MSKLGRPSEYTPETGDLICFRLVDGESLRSITSDPALPSIPTVFKWLREYPDFLKQYELARSAQCDTYADEMADIADDGTNDYMEKHNKDGSTYEVVNAEHIQRSRLRVDTRKWIAERMRPKKYGPNSTIDVNAKVQHMPTVERDGKELSFDVGTPPDTEST
jgi:hypothetical protein